MLWLQLLILCMENGNIKFQWTVLSVKNSVLGDNKNDNK